jgi:hypothetical protein
VSKAIKTERFRAMYSDISRRDKSHQQTTTLSKIELIDASIWNLFNEELWLSESCPNLL